MKNVWKKHKGKIISFLAGIGIGALTVAAQVENYENPLEYWKRILCDASFVAAVFLIGIGVLMWISTLGGFDHISYLFTLMKDRLVLSKKKFEQRKSYLDYVLEKRKKEKSKYPAEIIGAGVFYLAASLALVFLI
ncbi:MAG: DUF3899 domain-containing protein [Roseburia sp.]